MDLMKEIELLKSLALELNESSNNYKNITLEEEKELEEKFDLFEKTLYNIRLEGDMSVINDLSLLIDDEFFEPAIMEDIVEIIILIIEKYDLKKGLYIIFNNIDKILINGKFFFSMIIEMILNDDEEFIENFVYAINSLNDNKKEILINLLNEIKTDFENINKDYSKGYILQIEKIISNI